MLIKHRVLLDPDETSAADSSSAAGSDTVASQDVNETGDSSTSETQSSTEPTTVEEVVNKVFKDSQAASENEQQEQVSDTETETQPEGEETQEGEESTEQQQTTEKGPVPYSRFEEVNTVKNELESKVQLMEPLAKVQQEIADFCTDNGISADDFRYLMNLGAALKNNPEKALQLLEPHVQQLQAYKGDILPAELARDVEDGKITLEYAKQLASFQKQNQFKTQQLERTREIQDQQQARKYASEMQTSLSAWNRKTAAADPDFKKATDGKKGKYEVFMAVFDKEVQSAKSVAEAVGVADKVYKEVNQLFKQAKAQQGQKPAGKSVRSTTASVNGNHKQPTSSLEVAQQVMRRHGFTA